MTRDQAAAVLRAHGGAVEVSTEVREAVGVLLGTVKADVAEDPTRVDVMRVCKTRPECSKMSVATAAQAIRTSEEVHGAPEDTAYYVEKLLLGHELQTVHHKYRRCS